MRYPKLLHSIVLKAVGRVKNEFPIERFDAIVPDDAQDLMTHRYRTKWNYPWEGEVVDFASGLTKKAYPTRNKNARIACCAEPLDTMGKVL